MALVKSKLIKQLSNNYPNFLKKDLEKFSDIILNEIKRALKRGDRVELRGLEYFQLISRKLGYQGILEQERKLIPRKKKLFTLNVKRLI